MKIRAEVAWQTSRREISNACLSYIWAYKCLPLAVSCYVQQSE